MLRTPERMKVSAFELNPGEQRVTVRWQPSTTLAQPIYQTVPKTRDSLCTSFYTFFFFGRVWFSLWGKGVLSVFKVRDFLSALPRCWGVVRRDCLAGVCSTRQSFSSQFCNHNCEEKNEHYWAALH